MALRLYADECVDARIVAGLRRRSIDVRSVADEDLLGATDDVQLDRAARLQRVILTSDTDFLELAHRRAQHGLPHPGVLFIMPRTGVGDAIRAVVLAAEVLDHEEMASWIEWIP